MTPNEKELMGRYIYQVTRRLPKAQRDEVRMELEELIGDMYTDKGSIEEVLTQLGDPAELAKQYQNRQPYLIGPEYFDTYLWFVKVTLICTAVPILAVSLINALGETFAIASQNAVEIFARGLAGWLAEGIPELLLSCVSAFGAVTLIFAVMERQKVKIEMEKAEKWSVDKLTDGKSGTKPRWTPGFLEPIPDPKAVISRGDSIVGIVFTIIFCVLLIFAPHFFAAIFPQEGATAVVPIFNLEQWGVILPVFVLSMLIGLADEILRLVIGCYCRVVMISSIICNLLQITLSVIILKVLPLWNPNFILEIQGVLGDEADLAEKFLAHWNPDMVSNGILTFIVVIAAVEIGVTIYKTLRYGVAESVK